MIYAKTEMAELPLCCCECRVPCRVPTDCYYTQSVIKHVRPKICPLVEMPCMEQAAENIGCTSDKLGHKKETGKMKKFIVEAKRGAWGNLGEFSTLEEAELEVERQEADDKADGNYEKDYYMIIEVEK